MSTFKSYEEMSPDQRIAYDLGKAELEEVKRERDKALRDCEHMDGDRLVYKHRLEAAERERDHWRKIGSVAGVARLESALADAMEVLEIAAALPTWNRPMVEAKHAAQAFLAAREKK